MTPRRDPPLVPIYVALRATSALARRRLRPKRQNVVGSLDEEAAAGAAPRAGTRTSIIWMTTGRSSALGGTRKSWRKGLGGETRGVVRWRGTPLLPEQIGRAHV